MHLAYEVTPAAWSGEWPWLIIIWMLIPNDKTAHKILIYKIEKLKPFWHTFSCLFHISSLLCNSFLSDFPASACWPASVQKGRSWILLNAQSMFFLCSESSNRSPCLCSEFSPTWPACLLSPFLPSQLAPVSGCPTHLGWHTWIPLPAVPPTASQGLYLKSSATLT